MQPLDLRDDMTVVGTDLHRVDNEHSLAIRGRFRSPRAVAVVGDDDELESRTCGRGGDVIERAGPV